MASVQKQNFYGDEEYKEATFGRDYLFFISGHSNIREETCILCYQPRKIIFLTQL